MHCQTIHEQQACSSSQDSLIIIQMIWLHSMRKVPWRFSDLYPSERLCRLEVLLTESCQPAAAATSACKK